MNQTNTGYYTFHEAQQNRYRLTLWTQGVGTVIYECYAPSIEVALASVRTNLQGTSVYSQVMRIEILGGNR